MTKNEAIKLFEEKTVRTVWDDDAEEWYFSIIDVVAVLTDSPNPQVYWRVMKKRLLDEGNQTVTNCNAFKMQAADGKKRLTDCATTEQLFRLIQPIPSPKAAPSSSFSIKFVLLIIFSRYFLGKLFHGAVKITDQFLHLLCAVCFKLFFCFFNGLLL